MENIIFTSLPDYVGDYVAAEFEGFKFAARIMSEDDGGTPWENEDGHGPVSGWRRTSHAGRMGKAPGELLLCDDRGARRYYVFAAACRIALRDGWGVSPYRLDKSCNANGIWTVTAQWFSGRDLLSIEAIGDDLNRAISSVYAQHRATMSPRAYASLAARADFERLRGFCDGDWHYCGIIVTASRNGIELGSASLWGIESDAGDYLLEVANELACEVLDGARDAIESLCDRA